MSLSSGKLATSAADGVALAGMAFRLPGDLGDEESLWSALIEGLNPFSRGRVGRHLPALLSGEANAREFREALRNLPSAESLQDAQATARQLEWRMWTT